MSAKSAWLITAKTNLHVGNENTSSYGVVDKSVQRDVLTGLPCIHASSLKGALNEFLCHQEIKPDLKTIFGADKTDKTDSKETQKGSHTFFDAQLLSIPIQGHDCLFLRGTSFGVIKQFVNQLKLFGFETSKYDSLLQLDPTKKTSDPAIPLGEYKVIVKNFTQLATLQELFGDKRGVLIFDDNDFKEICEDLPIIARNKLEDGESANLWYEELVPKETIFYSILIAKDEDGISDQLSDKLIQIGANATIGYGYCQIKTILK